MDEEAAVLLADDFLEGATGMRNETKAKAVEIHKFVQKGLDKPIYKYYG